jgi:predicted transcriptional regulator
LANDNTPMTIRDLAERTGRPAETILRTLGGTRVYKGLRPTLD